MRRATVLLLLALPACSGGTPRATPTPSPAVTPFAPVVGQPSQVLAKIPVGGTPCGVAVVGHTVWVTDPERNRLVRIEGDRPVTTYPLKAKACELTYGFGSLWVATQSGTLERISPKTGQVLASIAVGRTSYEPVVAFGSVFVTNRLSGSVSRIDPRTNEVVRTYRVGRHPGGIVAHAGALWVGIDDNAAALVARIDPATGRRTWFRAAYRPAFVTAAGGDVWVASESEGVVLRLDGGTGTLKGSVPAGSRPVNLAALAGPRPEVWVPDDVGNLVTRIDATTGEVVERLAGGAGPAVVATGGGDVWVSMFGDGTVWHVRPGARA